MKTPKFWQKITILSILLYPFAIFYRFLGIIRNILTKSHKINKKILCIGNITAGGAGKTPTAIAFAKILQEMQIEFAFLAHGYKSKVKEFTLIDKENQKNTWFGDEALLLSDIEDTFISKNRLNAAQHIAKIPNKDLIIMDDGLQNKSIIKDCSILVIDGGYGFGNNMLIPSGPLRQSLKSAIKHIDLIIINGEDKFNYNKLISNKYKNIKIINSTIELIKDKDLKDKKLIAFCGIGRPQKFFDILKRNNYNLIKNFSFADHYFYKDKDLKDLIDLANKENATLVTTKKDFVRINKKYQENIKYLDIEMKFSQQDEQYIQNNLIKPLLQISKDK
ncbi:tetraacyldisaccharide 4'-kinase [Rickettsiales bacterium]|nr:tetraacyldisaccharide 4'-kinase [Rickettsiales bacterium]